MAAILASMLTVQVRAVADALQVRVPILARRGLQVEAKVQAKG
jgi:hypothetical protein